MDVATGAFADTVILVARQVLTQSHDTKDKDIRDITMEPEHFQ